MATNKQKQAARHNLEKARAARTARARGDRVPKRSPGLSAAEENRLDDDQFAFPEQRKEPLSDATHVRNAIARFNQVEGVSDADRDRAWKRILRAAGKFDVEVSVGNWRELAHHGKTS